MSHDGLGETLAELAEDTGRLVHLEIDLFKQELLDLVKRNAIAVGLLAGSVLTLFLGLIFLQVWLIALIPHHAIAAMVITVLWLSATAVLAFFGKNRIKLAAPQISIQSLKEDLEWVKEQIKPAPR